MAPTISSTCIECGMEKGHSLLYCPTCTLVKNQQAQFEKLEQKQSFSGASNSTGGGDDIWDVIGGLIAFPLVFGAIAWAVSDMGYWESVLYVIMIPIYVFIFVFQIIIGLFL